VRHTVKTTRQIAANGPPKCWLHRQVISEIIDLFDITSLYKSIIDTNGILLFLTMYAGSRLHALSLLAAVSIYYCQVAITDMFRLKIY